MFRLTYCRVGVLLSDVLHALTVPEKTAKCLAKSNRVCYENAWKKIYQAKETLEEVP